MVISILDRTPLHKARSDKIVFGLFVEKRRSQ